MSLKDESAATGSGAGYVKVQRHPRNAMASFGFALVTVAAFSAALTVPCIAQSNLTGYKYPAKQVRQTQPQDGWLYTAANPPVFDPTITVAPIEQSQAEGSRVRAKWIRQTEQPAVYSLLGTYSPALGDESIRPAKKPWREQTSVQDGWLSTAATPVFDPTVAVAPVCQSRLDGSRYPTHTVRQTDPQDGWVETGTHDWAVERTPYSLDQRMSDRAASAYRYDGYGETPWIYLNLPVADVWDESKFQNNSGEFTPIRPALKFRYPLASSGFSTDGSTPDVWDATRFQNNHGERTLERRGYDPRYEHHKFSFGLLDARVVMPAIDQLANSERAATRRRTPNVTPDSYGWLYPNVPAPFDPRLLVQISAPTRMGERVKLDVRPGQFYNDMAWLRDVLGLPDPPIVMAEGIYRPTYRPRRRA